MTRNRRQPSPFATAATEPTMGLVHLVAWTYGVQVRRVLRAYGFRVQTLR